MPPVAVCFLFPPRAGLSGSLDSWSNNLCYLAMGCFVGLVCFSTKGFVRVGLERVFDVHFRGDDWFFSFLVFFSSPSMVGLCM